MQYFLVRQISYSLAFKCRDPLQLYFLFNSISLHARLSNHYKAWSYKEKKKKRTKKNTENLLERAKEENVSLNSRHKAIWIACPKKTFCRKIIPESSRV